MTIRPSEIPDYLTHRNQVEIRYDSGDLAILCTVREIMQLARLGMIAGHITRKNALKYCTLNVPVGVARRVVRGMRMPDSPAHAITHRKQDPGACRWVPRPDRANCGQAGATRTLSIRG